MTVAQENWLLNSLRLAQAPSETMLSTIPNKCHYHTLVEMTLGFLLTAMQSQKPLSFSNALFQNLSYTRDKSSYIKGWQKEQVIFVHKLSSLVVNLVAALNTLLMLKNLHQCSRQC